MLLYMCLPHVKNYQSLRSLEKLAFLDFIYLFIDFKFFF